MTKFYYLKLSKSKKIRYLKHMQKDSDYIVFLHGFMSDLEGKKPKVFLNFAKSTGKFTKGNISKWTRETYLLLKKTIKKNKIFFIGSSMGAWISLNQFKFFKNQIKGFLGIGSAPEFLENLMWKKFTKKMKAETIKKGIYYLKHGNYTYPITLQLLSDGRKNKVFNKKIRSKIKVTMVHGQKDDVVPVSYSKKMLKIFTNAKKKLVIVKNGDHSLSSNKGLKILKKEIKLITS